MKRFLAVFALLAMSTIPAHADNGPTRAAMIVGEARVNAVCSTLIRNAAETTGSVNAIFNKLYSQFCLAPNRQSNEVEAANMTNDGWRARCEDLNRGYDRLGLPYYIACESPNLLFPEGFNL
jgi:hypothetical protein